MFYIVQNTGTRYMRVIETDLPIRVIVSFLKLGGDKERMIGASESIETFNVKFPDMDFPPFTELFRKGKETGKTYLKDSAKKELEVLPIPLLEEWLKGYLKHASDVLSNQRSSEYFLQAHQEEINCFTEFIHSRQNLVP